MKLATFLKTTPKLKPNQASISSWEIASKARWGAVIERDGKRFIKDLTSKKLPTLLSLIEAGPGVLKTLRAEEKKWRKARKAPGTALEKVKLISPLPRPPSMRDFLAFEEHSSWSWKKRGLELPPEWYEMPVYYKGNHRTLFGHSDTIPWPSFTQKLDYELELAMIVGRPGENISKEKAPDHIFGYSVMNDWSARDIQAKEMICRLGPAKGKDFATSVGPWIVTADELDITGGVQMQALINDEQWSNGNSSKRHWSFSDMIAHVSKNEKIYSGDIYGSGTVGKGCGLELDRWLKHGDKVRLEIEGIGALENTVQSVSQTGLST